MLALYVILGVFGALILFMLLRTIFTKKPTLDAPEGKDYGLAQEAMVYQLKQHVQIPSVYMARRYAQDT